MHILRNNECSGPSFTLGNRIHRQIWNWVWLLLFRPSPRPAHAWRAALLRLFGAKLGKAVHVYASVKVWAPWQLRIDDHGAVADNAILYNIERIRIGEHAVVSQGSHLCTGSHDYNSRNFQLIASPIDIAPRAWICADCFLGPGVTIPEGAVVAARSVVTKPLASPWTVYAGTPARAIGNRIQHEP